MTRIEWINVPAATRLATPQPASPPVMGSVYFTVFVGDHGIAVEAIPGFSRAGTMETLQALARGEAAVGVVAPAAAREIIDLGTVHDPGPLQGVKSYRLGAGTANFTQKAAMTEHQLAKALHAGRHAAERARLAGARLFIGAGVGSANHIVAAALSCALLQRVPEHFLRSANHRDGTFSPIVSAHIIQRALSLHRDQLHLPLECLRCLGGFEIAALTGASLACAQMGLPMLADGLVGSTAALVATRLRPGVVAR